jgi:hypothetical protein
MLEMAGTTARAAPVAGHGAAPEGMCALRLQAYLLVISFTFSNCSALFCVAKFWRSVKKLLRIDVGVGMGGSIFGSAAGAARQLGMSSGAKPLPDSLFEVRTLRSCSDEEFAS